MELRLIRYYEKKGATDGTLLISGKHFCDTAEHTPVSLRPGKYVVKIRVFQGRKMPVLYKPQGKKPLGCIRCGNGVYRLHDGSIIVGCHAALGLCVHSGITFGRLVTRFRKCVERKESIFLIVENHTV